MKERIYLFDNLKAVLIFFVVVGHFTSLNRFHNPLIGAVNNVIYSFHMPLFIFVSGYFSRGIMRQRADDIERLLFTYINFQILSLLFVKLLTGTSSMNIFIPSYHNWYLLGMFIWRLVAPYFKFSSRSFSLLCTIVISFLIGFYPQFDSFLALYRSFYFLPFFLMGYLIEDPLVKIYELKKYRIPAAILLLLLLTIILLASIFNKTASGYIYYAFTPYSGYDGSMLFFLLRLIGFAGSLIIGFCIILLFSNKECFYSKYGIYTMNVYLLHMFFVSSLSLLPFNQINQILSLLFFLILSFIIVWLLSNDFVTKIISPLTDFKNLKSILNGGV